MSASAPPPPPASTPGPATPAAKPDNYLVWAILTTIFCCLPFGIVAIVKSTKVDGLWASGQYPAAEIASAEAKRWSIIAAVVGLVVGALSSVIWIIPVLLNGRGQ